MTNDVTKVMTGTAHLSPYVYLAAAGLAFWVVARWVVILGI